MKPAILNDLTKCIGCEACALACKEINELPAEGRDKLSASTWTTVENRAGVYVRQQCMHCLEPACVSVCPVGALHKTPEGPIVYDESRCIGCRYCMVGCPFNIPKYEWDSPMPKVQKCIMCFEKRLQHGEEPACTAACPTGATIFGDRDELLDVAHHRIREAPDRYVDRIYGQHEAGGTSVLYISDVPFEQLGFKTELQGSPYPALTWAVLSKLPSVVSVGGVLMCGLWWLTKRKETVQRVEGRHAVESAPVDPEVNGGKS